MFLTSSRCTEMYVDSSTTTTNPSTPFRSRQEDTVWAENQKDYQVLRKLSRHHEVLGWNGKTFPKRAIVLGICKIHLQKSISEYLENKTGKAVGISHFHLLHFIFIFRGGEGQIVFKMKVFVTMIQKKSLLFLIKLAFTDTHWCLTFPPSALLRIKESLFRECCFFLWTHLYDCNTLGTCLSVFKYTFKHTLLMYLISLNIHKIWINSQDDWIGSKLWSM